MPKQVVFRTLFTELIPKPADTKTLLVFIGVMEKDDAAGPNLVDPCSEIMLYRFIRMKSINMKEINRAIIK